MTLEMPLERIRAVEQRGQLRTVQPPGRRSSGADGADLYYQTVATRRHRAAMGHGVDPCRVRRADCLRCRLADPVSFSGGLQESDRVFAGLLRIRGARADSDRGYGTFDGVDRYFMRRVSKRLCEESIAPSASSGDRRRAGVFRNKLPDATDVVIAWANAIRTAWRFSIGYPRADAVEEITRESKS